MERIIVFLYELGRLVANGSRKMTNKEPFLISDFPMFFNFGFPGQG